MAMSDPNFLLALFLLICSGIGTATALVWKLTRVEQSLREAIARSRDEIEANHAVEARIYNETLMALRQKISDVELDAARSYMRRDGYHQMQQQFSDDMKALREAIDSRFVRMEEKIDKITLR
jgi:hypothetical protein